MNKNFLQKLRLNKDKIISGVFIVSILIGFAMYEANKNKTITAESSVENSKNENNNSNSTKEEDKKQSEGNKKIYADFIKDIESSYSSMKIYSIDGKDKAKTLNIYMTLLNSKDATYFQCAKLTTDKETKMKEIGISEIMIYVKNKAGENQGIISFELDAGRYEPRINTLK